MRSPSTTIGTCARRLAPAGPLASVVVFALFLAVLWSVARALLTAMNHHRVGTADGWWWLFAVGLRIDSVQACYLLALPTIAALALPATALRRAWWAFAIYYAAVAAIVVYLEIASAPFLAEFDSRPNRIFIDYLSYPAEVARTVWADHKLAIAIAIAVMAASAVGLWIATRAAIADATAWPWALRLVILPFACGLLFIGARGTLSHRPINISTAAFSSVHIVNQLALNSTYSLTYAIYSLKDEHAPDRLYGRMDDDEVLARVRRVNQLGPAVDPALPTLHHAGDDDATRPPNVVILLQESLDAAFCGCLGGIGVTPELDALAQEGLLLTRLFATGTRTVRGIEAVIAGYPPAPSASVVRLDRSQTGFFTLADLLGRHGYHTEFIYGGESHFDNMRGFMLGNGFDQIHDQANMGGDVEFAGTWGMCDGDLVRKANAIFASHGDQPFFAMMLSTSNHTPFEFPDGHIALHEQPKATVTNAVKYADFAIGEFFRLARREAYFKDTIFLVVADHNGRVWGGDIVPVPKFHIPGLLIGPGVEPGRFAGLASQIDLPVTLLALTGIDASHPMIGQDLLRRADGDPGRAIMQRDQFHGYRVGDEIVVHRPHDAPLQFHCVDDRLVPMALNAELERDALAHALLPSLLYNRGAYHLPTETAGH